MSHQGIIAIDGCNKCCALKTITREGLSCTDHIDLETLCPAPERINETFVNKIAKNAAQALS